MKTAIGYTIDEFANYVLSIEPDLDSGATYHVTVCTNAMPTREDLASIVINADSGGFATSFPVCQMVDGIPTTQFTLSRSRTARTGGRAVGQLALILPLIVPLAIVGIVAYGLTRIGSISNAIMPILLIAVGGIVLVAIALRKPAEKVATAYVERGGKIPLLPDTRKNGEFLIITDYKGNMEIDYHKDNSDEDIYIILESGSDKNTVYSLITSTERKDLDNAWPVHIPDSDSRSEKLRDIWKKYIGKLLPRTLGRRDYYMRDCLKNKGMGECSKSYNEEYGITPKEKRDVLPATEFMAKSNLEKVLENQAKQPTDKFYKENPPSPMEYGGLKYYIHMKYEHKAEAEQEADALTYMGRSRTAVQPWEGGFVVYEHPNKWDEKDMKFVPRVREYSPETVVLDKPETIKCNASATKIIERDLRYSIQEEQDAFYAYEERQQAAAILNDPKTAAIYSEIKAEELQHKNEFSKRLEDVGKLQRDFLPDSAEFMAETIAQDGWRDKLESAFMSRIEALKVA